MTARDGGTAWLRASVNGRADSTRVLVDFPTIPTPVPFVAFGMPTEATGTLPTHCGLAASGAAWCSPSTQFTTFTALPGGHAFRDVRGSQRATCGLTTSDEVYCWGMNHHANLGTGSLTPASSATPLLAAGGRRFSAIALGGHALVCGIGMADSLAWCWGHNDFAQTGRLPVTTTEPVAAPVPGLPKVRQISAGSFNGCAIAIDGSTWCWGHGFFVYADTTYQQRIAALRQVAGPGVYTNVAAGNSHACGLTPTGVAECFVGDATPSRVTGAPPLVRLFNAAVANAWCGLTATGAAWCWSIGLSSQPGGTLPATAFRRTKSFRDFAVGYQRRCGVATDGRMYC